MKIGLSNEAIESTDKGVGNTEIEETFKRYVKEIGKAMETLRDIM